MSNEVRRYGIPRNYSVTMGDDRHAWNLWHWSNYHMAWVHVSTLESAEEARQLAHELNQVVPQVGAPNAQPGGNNELRGEGNQGHGRTA